jgi:uncharacterized protein (DUF2252 family)
MSESPFCFYRGAAAIMASDLPGTPRTGITAQLCGDAHMLNLRLLASPEQHLMFDINDFDETPPGPWEWDVKRLSASMVIAGRQNGFTAKGRAVVGTRCWIILFQGRDDQDPLLLLVKEATESVLAEHVGPSAYDNQGQRVVAGQRLMQATSDIMLGWSRVTGVDSARRDFYVRQLLDWKASPSPRTWTRG